MRPVIIEPGTRYGRWTVQDEGPQDRDHHRRYWCQCQCGARSLVRASVLIRGASLSCRCGVPPIPLQIKHGHTRRGMKSSEYSSWHNMKTRCENPAAPDYATYGAVGITCDSWSDSFETLLAEMGPKPTPAHTLERIDNSLGYSKANCRWATRKEQAANRRTTRFFTHEGVTLNITDWAKRIGVSHGKLQQRLQSGLSFVDAITLPHRATKLIKQRRNLA